MSRDEAYAVRGNLSMKHFVVLAALLLSACHSASVSPDRAAQIRTVGIVSALEPVALEYAGAVGSGSGVAVPVNGPSLGVDAFVVERVSAMLRDRYELHPVSFDPYAVINIEPPWAHRPSDMMGAPHLTSVVPQGLDAYVLVVPGLMTEPGTNLFRKNFAISGLGVVKIQGVLADTTFAIHVPYRVYVLDGHDGSEIAMQALFFGADDLWREVDQTWWAASPAELSPEQRRRLATAFEDLIGRTLPTAVNRLRLTP
jgi:hypothetical protein